MSLPSIDKTAMIDLIKQMVKIDSINPSLVPGAAGESEMAEFCADWMRRHGMKTKVYDVEPGRSNAVGVLKGVGDGETLLFNGHSDTVGVDYMTIEPFEPVVKDGKLYGRGSFDMKGGLAASMAAIKSMVDAGIELKGDIILAVVCDEEFASIGTEKLMEDTRADAAIISESTAENIQIAHKGFAWIDIETHGVAAHGSNFFHGVDAIAKMGHVLIGIESLQRILMEGGHQLLGPGSIHASIINGGRELSTYPDHCKLEIERRTVPNETRTDIEDEMQALLQSLREADPKFKGDFKITFYRNPMEISPEKELCQVLKRGTETLLGFTPRFTGGHGWMDSEIIYSKGIPVVCHGPNGTGAHSKEEWVDLESVYNIARVQAYAINEICG